MKVDSWAGRNPVCISVWFLRKFACYNMVSRVWTCIGLASLECMPSCQFQSTLSSFICLKLTVWNLFYSFWKDHPGHCILPKSYSLSAWQKICYKHPGLAAVVYREQVICTRGSWRVSLIHGKLQGKRNTFRAGDPVIPASASFYCPSWVRMDWRKYVQPLLRQVQF